jgi:NADH-quinone oxidoreductase subunit F
MPRLVSHPDEVIVLKRRFGQGAAEIDQVCRVGRLCGGAEGYCAGRGAMPGWIIDTMKSSGLRGRGGAGFPTG